MKRQRHKVACAGDNSGMKTKPFITSEADTQQHQPISRMKHLFGFEISDILSFNKLVLLLYTPRDASSLGFFRIALGRCCEWYYAISIRLKCTSVQQAKHNHAQGKHLEIKLLFNGDWCLNPMLRA